MNDEEWEVKLKAVNKAVYEAEEKTKEAENELGACQYQEEMAGDARCIAYTEYEDWKLATKEAG